MSDSPDTPTVALGSLPLGRTAPAPTTTMRPDDTIVGRQTPFEVDALPELTRDRQAGGMPEIEIRQLLGEGGMAEVRLARQLPLGRDVAVKSAGGAPEGTSDEEKLILLRESWVTGRLEHPNIVPVHTLGRNEAGEPMLVMKKIGGISWLELLRDPSKSPRDFDSENPLDWHLEILSRVCDAVHFAHSKDIIHRDIKPENIMIGEFGEVYLLDWGIAVSLQDDPHGRLPVVSDISSPAGTPVYMAPEMVACNPEALCPQTDVFLLGGVLHEIVTGEPPNCGESIEEIMQDAYETASYDYEAAGVHPDLATICRKAMRQEPDARFESAEALRQAVAHHMHHRESIQMSREAEERLAELEAVLADETETSEPQIYQTFGESRFGFEQALRVSPDNTAARQGLQAVLERMAHREIERGAYQAASLLVADLPEPNSKLEAKLEQLEADLASREEEFEELKRMRHEEDVEVARGSRSILAMLLAVIWSGMTLALPPVARWLEQDLSAGFYLLYAVPVGLLVVLAAGAKINSLLQNRANQKFAVGLGIVVISGISVRLAGSLLSLSILQTMSMEMLTYAGGGAVLAATMDKRLFWAIPPFFIGGLLAALIPSSAFIVFALASFLGMSGVAWAWWPEDPELSDC